MQGMFFVHNMIKFGIKYWISRKNQISRNQTTSLIHGSKKESQGKYKIFKNEWQQNITNQNYKIQLIQHIEKFYNFKYL